MVKGEFNHWIQFRSAKKNPGHRLFCFPFAGGGASQYATWKSFMGEEIEVVPIQLPGRENRVKETFITDPEELLDQVIDSVYPLIADGDFSVFGHSMGGLLAFRFAKKLEKKYQLQSKMLFISATGMDSKVRDKKISVLPEQEFLHEVESFGGLEKELWNYPEFLQLYINILRHDFRLIENYNMEEKEPVSIPIRVYYGTEDCCVGKEQAESWRNYTTEGFSMKEFKGDHFFLKSKKQELCQDIKQSIENRVGS